MDSICEEEVLTTEEDELLITVVEDRIGVEEDEVHLLWTLFRTRVPLLWKREPKAAIPGRRAVVVRTR
jgi:hypothetical protein